MKRYFSILPLTMLLLAACQTQDSRTLPDTEPDIRGNITSLKRTSAKKSAGIAVVLVESVEGIETKHAKANLRIDANTYIEGADGVVLRLEQLREGQMIEAWFDGPVMESTPIQATVSAIRVNY